MKQPCEELQEHSRGPTEEKARDWEKAGRLGEQTTAQRLGKELGGGRVWGGRGYGRRGWGGARGGGPDACLSLGAMETQEF